MLTFGLTKAPVIFQHLMNDIFRDYLDQFIIINLDDILVFFLDPTLHYHHVRIVINHLWQHELYAKVETRKI